MHAKRIRRWLALELKSSWSIAWALKCKTNETSTIGAELSMTTLRYTRQGCSPTLLRQASISLPGKCSLKPHSSVSACDYVCLPRKTHGRNWTLKKGREKWESVCVTRSKTDRSYYNAYDGKTNQCSLLRSSFELTNIRFSVFSVSFLSRNFMISNCPYAFSLPGRLSRHQ